MGTLESRARRKADGLCMYCGKRPPEKGKMGCTECYQKRREAEKESRKFYLSIGICPICHKRKVAKNRTACPECLAKYSEISRRRYAMRKLARGT